MIEPSYTQQDRLWDVCVAGSGPVGLAVAVECESHGLRVLLLESGGSERSDGLNTATIVDPLRHAPMELATCRGLGGTSWTWGGRCVPFDDIDFANRPYVPDSSWPLCHDDIRNWYPRAAEHLDCGAAEFEAAPAHAGGLGPNVSADTLERWSRKPRLGSSLRSRIEASALITVCLGSTLVDLEMNEGVRAVEAAVILSAGQRIKVRAKYFVLATGGIETTRLLLSVQERRPFLFGGLGGPLGRYYMGHISGKIASIQFSRPHDVEDFDFFLSASGSWVRRRFLLTQKALDEQQILNTAFWPDNSPFYDSSHRSGVLSSVFLALAIPPIGRKILPEAIRLAHTGPRPLKVAAHVGNAVIGGPRAASDLFEILRGRYIQKPRKPGFLVRTSSGLYALHYHAEQEPNPDSRITLAQERDQFGIKKAQIDFRFTTRDVLSVILAHKVLDGALRSSGAGKLNFWHDEDVIEEKVWVQAADGFHQAGTTRMGNDSRTSVVNENLRVHGIENLFVASSSVFVTTGQANSTFPAVSLAFRLGNLISAEASRQHVSVAGVECAKATDGEDAETREEHET